MDKLQDIDRIMRGAVRTSVVPTIEDMKRQAENERRKRLAEEKKEFLAKSTEEQNREIEKNMPFSEMLAGLKDSVHDIYPDSSVVMIGIKPLDDKSTNVVFEYAGKEEELWAALNECMCRSEVALKMVNRAIMLFCRTAKADLSEQTITALQDIIKDLRKHNTDETRVLLLKSEIKRLKKAGRLDVMAIREQELRELEQSIEKKKLRHKQQIEALVKARAAKAEKKRKRLQAEKDRNRQQPNFQKLAKKKMQKIAARQAERNQRKSAGSGGDVVKSCSMFNNAG